MEGGYSFLGPDMEVASEIVKDRLYFVTFSKKNFTIPSGRAPPHFFCIDDQLVYSNFFADFGPLHLGHLYRYWVILNEKLKSPTLHGKRIVHWTTTDSRKRANAAYLIGSFAVVQLKMSPREVYRLLMSIKHPFIPFQDASAGVSQYKIRLIDCLNAINKAFYYGLVRFDDFDLASYEYYEQVENGDLNWIVPGKLLALSGPVPSPEFGCTPEHYLDYFKKNQVSDVIRLNKASYQNTRFSESGIQVHELYFTDGSAPGKGIVYKFFSIVENTPGAVAVHCKAGLGRTGCLIGAYIVKHYKMSACESISWMRICRPGCVIGHQQTWLERCEKYLHRSGELFRLRHFGDIDRMPLHQYGVYSLARALKYKEESSEISHISNEKVHKNNRKKSSMLLMGASSVGASMGRLMTGFRRSTTASKSTSKDWSQGETLKAKKWERGISRQSKLIIKKRRQQESSSSS